MIVSPPPDSTAGQGDGADRPDGPALAIACIPATGPIADLVVRDAAPGDLAAVRAIYASHVLDGMSSFEETPPDDAEMARRFTAITGGGFPYLVAEAGGLVLGYSYASQFRPRPAYRYTVENSIYVRPGLLGRGIGRALLETLKQRCAAAGFRQMIAVIGTVGADSPSILLHRRHGFSETARLAGIGFKFGRWVDGVIMQCPLGSGSDTPPDGIDG